MANTIINKIKLYEKTDFILYQYIFEDEKKKDLVGTMIKYKNKVLTQNYTETVAFFSMLDSLSRKMLSSGDENHFFKFSQKTDEKKNIIKSLQFKYDPVVYISSDMAKTMNQIFYESKIGLSLQMALSIDYAYISIERGSARAKGKEINDPNTDDEIFGAMRDYLIETFPMSLDIYDRNTHLMRMINIAKDPDKWYQSL